MILFCFRKKVKIKQMLLKYKKCLSISFGFWFPCYFLLFYSSKHRTFLLLNYFDNFPDYPQKGLFHPDCRNSVEMIMSKKAREKEEDREKKIFN